MLPKRCPCGTRLPYDGCCGRLHDGTATAATRPPPTHRRERASGGEEGVLPLLATWDAATRPRTLELDPAVRRACLEVLATSGGGLFDAGGTVSFRAHSRAGGEFHVQAERSRLRRAGGCCVHVDGDTA